MKDPQQTVSWRRSGIRDHLPILDDPDFGDLPTATDPAAGLIDLRFIGSVLRRGRRLWALFAVVGLVVGAGLVVERSHKHSAVTTLLLATATSGQEQASEMATDASIAQSVPVATAVVAQLGLQQTPVSFLGTYAATSTTPGILAITASGPSGSAAVQRAAAIAKQFLIYRANYLQQELQETASSLRQQVSQAQQALDSIDAQLSKSRAEASSPSQQAEVDKLTKEQTQAQDALGATMTDEQVALTQARTQTTEMVQSSQVLSPPIASLPTGKKTLVMYVVGGLIIGLGLGMGIVITAGITSGKLRRRDDIAIAAGAPVKLSVGSLRAQRQLPSLGKQANHPAANMERFVDHLRNAVPENSRSRFGLAVVAVDGTPTVARAVVKLAVAFSQQRRRVVVADLAAGALAARGLGVTGPGINTVSPEGVPVVVVVPESTDVAPVGPLRTPPPGLGQVSERLADTCAHADLVLTLVTLDPSFGGEYLGTWATDAVLVVTAGQSSAVRIHAASEMIRLAGIRLGSVVLLDADKADESLGTVSADYQPSSSVRQ